MIKIRVPCSSANIGPGFDVIGLALSLYLEVQVEAEPQHALVGVGAACSITYEGPGKAEVSLDPNVNLITRVALYVLRCHGIRQLPERTHIHIVNAIPLGRGLGSSGAAVVAGVVLADELGQLCLKKARILDYCLMIERHPDNVAAALYGGFIGTYLNELSPEDTQWKEIPLSEVLPQPAGGLDTGLTPPEPPHDIGHFKQLKWAKEIRCIAIVPDFEVSTGTAREVLPQNYSRSDMVFNMQRIALLVTALGESPADEQLIFQAMQDKVHQPYRGQLVPGLANILRSVTPESHPGLLGICLSGAGPTILALATKNFEQIAQTLISKFKEEGITCEWKLLEPANDGATVTRTATDDEAHSSSTANSRGMTYADAGVSIDKGNEVIRRIKDLVKSTQRPGATAEIGGFGGTIDLAAAGFAGAPILVQAIDGVGTKLKLVAATGRHSDAGIDLVAMNVNDLVVQGAEPISFLDYFSSSKLDVEVMSQFIAGVADGCRQAGCALVGGETAEMPGMYTDGEYDVAGAATGVIPRGQVLLPNKAAMKSGDQLIGLASSGAHSNGFSLIRKILDRESVQLDQPAPWLHDSTITSADSLLAPTKIYVQSCLALTRKHLLKGMAHITGGGLLENIPRMLPDHLAAKVHADRWPVPPLLAWLKRAGQLSAVEFARTWNTGLGIVLVVDETEVDQVLSLLAATDETVFRIGELVQRPTGETGCIIENLAAWNQ